MTSRLTTVAPEIENSFLGVSEELTNSIALSIASWAVKCNGSVGDHMQNLAEFIDAKLAIDVSNAFDERYFECKDQNPSVALKYFSCARAASSMAFALSKNPKEAIYEAIIATDDLATIKNLVTKALSNG